MNFHFKTCVTPPENTTTEQRDGNNEKIDLPSMIIPIAIIQDPRRLFMAVRFNFATKNDIPIESVRFKGIFRDNLEFGVKDFVILGDDEEDPMAWINKFQQIEKRSKDYVIALSGLILQGVNWDYGR